MDCNAVTDFVSRKWDRDIVAQLVDYIRIPCKSPHFDPHWEPNGHIEAAAQLAHAWCRAQAIPGMRVELVRLHGRTPLLFFEVPGVGNRTVLLYGHLDKQPEMVGWREALGPFTPVLENGRLYGRGAADDGYAVFACITAILALQEHRIEHARCVGLIECCEESGSYDLPAYLAALSARIGSVDMVIGLDSGCGNYDQLWITTSLRGIVAGTLSVEVLTEGVHSGDASGIVPSSFRLARALLDRIEDASTGEVLPGEFHCAIPPERIAQAQQAGAILRDTLWTKFPFAAGTRPMVCDPTEAVLNRTWRPFLCVLGADGLPPIADAGNVLRPRTALKLSMRVPPQVDAQHAAGALKRILEADPPAGAQVSFTPDQGASGWSAPPSAGWLHAAVNAASQAYYGRPAAMMGEGGTIPFMALLGKHYPAAQFLITGVLGPESNAHGPNEFLHIACAKKLTCCVAHVLAAHAQQQ